MGFQQPGTHPFPTETREKVLQNGVREQAPSPDENKGFTLALKRLGRQLIISTWPNFWWWATVILSVPFTAYAMVYVLAIEPAIREMSVAKEDGFPDVGTYSQGILDHIKLWQVHSLCAIIYILTAPLQFVDSVRLKRIPFHRSSGYAFLASGVILALTGLAMSPYSEFGAGFVSTSLATGPAWLFCAANAVWSIKKKRFQVHREWMIRTAAIGFSVMFVRVTTIPLKMLLNCTFKEAGVAATWICFVLSVVGSQLYIEMRYHGYGGLVPPLKEKVVYKAYERGAEQGAERARKVVSAPERRAGA